MHKLGDDLTTPPGKLRARVHGDESQEEFIRVGKLLSYNIFSSVVSLAEKTGGNQILEFGCGCGRVISHLSGLLLNNQFFGTDIDQEAITWCNNNLSTVAEFTANDAYPPLPFEDSFFDVVYSISVFTHLPEEMQFLWLEELKRVTRKGAYLLITTHGEELAPARIRKQMSKHGFHYGVSEGTDGLPDFYQTTFHTENYIRRHWSSYFAIVKIVKKGILVHQELVICRRTNP